MGSYLSDKDAIVIELRLQNLLIERFGVELVARPSFNWVSQVSNNDIEFVSPLLQLSPKLNNIHVIINNRPSHKRKKKTKKKRELESKFYLASLMTRLSFLLQNAS